MTATRQQDAIDVLVTQHHQIKELFKQTLAATGDEKRELFEDLVRLLAVHESAEEEMVHPLARRKIESGSSVVDSRLREEQEAKQVLADLYKMGTGDPRFDTHLTQLRDAVVDHAEHEEHEEFSQLRRTVPEDQLRKLAKGIVNAEKMAPTRPHPKAPPTATSNLIAGPPMAVFDRIRDAIRDTRQERG